MHISLREHVHEEPPQQQSLAEFQGDFGRFLRAPSGYESPAVAASADNIPARVGDVYRELVFNNVRGFINQCFPVCQRLLTENQWYEISRYFFQSGDLHSPYFSDINRHFVDFLAGLSDEQQQRLSIPSYLADLAHYEWIELSLDTYMDQQAKLIVFDDGGSFSFLPALCNAHYSWPVHTIGANDREPEPEDTFFLIFRRTDHSVQFMQTNALSYALIECMQSCANNEQRFPNLRTLMTQCLEDIALTASDEYINFAIAALEQIVAAGAATHTTQE